MKKKFFKLLQSGNEDDMMILQELIRNDNEYKDLAIRVHHYLSNASGDFGVYRKLAKALLGKLGKEDPTVKQAKSYLKRMGYDVKNLEED